LILRRAHEFCAGTFSQLLNRALNGADNLLGEDAGCGVDN
jgi:hypothetical protein